MYLDFLRLGAAPFAISPDPAFLYPSDAQQRASRELRAALASGAGVLLVRGEVGLGKSLLARQLGGALQLPNPCLTSRVLLRTLAAGAGLRAVEARPDDQLRIDLLDALLARATAGGRRAQGGPLVVFDEAQAMPPEVLETLRQLCASLEPAGAAPQVVLLGQPELDVALRRRDLRALASRVAFTHTLGPLQEHEVPSYLAHRLAVAGAAEPEAVFPDPVAALVHRAARGVPRQVNIVAHKCLLLATADARTVVNEVDVRTAAADTPNAGHLGWFAGLRLRRLRRAA